MSLCLQSSSPQVVVQSAPASGVHSGGGLGVGGLGVGGVGVGGLGVGGAGVSITTNRDMKPFITVEESTSKNK